MNLAGSVIIVTGSATGLGSATAKLVASKGANVVINYTKSEVEAKETVAACQELGVEVLLCKADVSVDQDCRHLGAHASGQVVLVDDARFTRLSHRFQESIFIQRRDGP